MAFWDSVNFHDSWSLGPSENQHFEIFLRCYSMKMLPGPQRLDVCYGGKCILPPSALDRLTRLNIAYPMLFEFQNNALATPKSTFGGVLEFIAEEGRVYLPDWMMQTLSLEQGDLLTVINVELPLGSFVKLQPQSPDFLMISDPKAVLESVLRFYSCLTKGEIFEFYYNETVFRMAVIEVQPESKQNAISVVETDLMVDFDAPVGYVEPEQVKSTDKRNSNGYVHISGTMAKKIGYEAFVTASEIKNCNNTIEASGGQRISGKPIAHLLVPLDDPSDEKEISLDTLKPLPLNLPSNILFFGFPFKPLVSNEDDTKSNENDKYMKGQGCSLRAQKKSKKST